MAARCNSPVGLNLEGLGTTDSSSWTHDSLFAANHAWRVRYELGRRLAERWI